MDKNPYISVVIPLYNESRVLNELHQRIQKVLVELNYSYEILFCNDGSTDDTQSKLMYIQTLDPFVKIIELTRNSGQTAALASGIDHAKGEIIITLDGDLQHDPELFPQFIDRIKDGYDIVSGRREKREDNLITRKIPSYVANKLAYLLTGIKVIDFGSTYKAYKSELVKSIELFGELHRFIPILASIYGAKITEIPIKVKERKYGISNYGLSRIFGVFQDLIFLKFYTSYLTKPIRAFGKLFFFFFGIGFLISLTLMSLWSIGYIKAVLEHEALLLLSVFLMIIGIQFLITGILAEILMRIYLNTSNKKIYTIKKIY